MVILVTGKAGAGKTTYAERLLCEFTLRGQRCTLLDGDIERLKHSDKDFSDEGRSNHLLRMATKAATFESEGYLVIVAAVAPKQEWRDSMRRFWKESRLVYIPGGSLWPGSEYQEPVEKEYLPYV